MWVKLFPRPRKVYNLISYRDGRLSWSGFACQTRIFPKRNLTSSTFLKISMVREQRRKHNDWLSPFSQSRVMFDLIFHYLHRFVNFPNPVFSTFRSVYFLRTECRQSFLSCKPPCSCGPCKVTTVFIFEFSSDLYLHRSSSWTSCFHQFLYLNNSTSCSHQTRRQEAKNAGA